jgi:transcriptional regulator with XRE-family HTH domain
MLAGVSPEYYMRLEQGRDHHPSDQVLDALARALRLDEDATAHLHRLAQPGARRRPRRRQRPERVPGDIAGLIDSWDTTPAYIMGRYTDVLAVNALATALAPFYTAGTNLLRAAFLDPRVQDMHPGWEATTGRPSRAALPSLPDPRRRGPGNRRLPRRPWQPDRPVPGAPGVPERWPATPHRMASRSRRTGRLNGWRSPRSRALTA